MKKLAGDLQLTTSKGLGGASVVLNPNKKRYITLSLLLLLILLMMWLWRVLELVGTYPPV